jgi:hypothetical protein
LYVRERRQLRADLLDDSLRRLGAGQTGLARERIVAFITAIAA